MSTREVVEKRYGSDPAYEEPGLTARELRDWSGDRLPTFVTSDLARDLIAAQARIAELDEVVDAQADGWNADSNRADAAEARIAKVKALPAKWVVDGDGDGDVCRCANELKAALEAP